MTLTNFITALRVKGTTIRNWDETEVVAEYVNPVDGSTEWQEADITISDDGKQLRIHPKN